jgi:hypothetical protein
VSIIAKNRDTLDGLERYLSGCRVRVEISALGDCPDDDTTAVVLFPDEFEAAELLRYVDTLHRSERSILLVLVTRDTRRVPGLAAVVGRVVPVVLPRPTFGWRIVEAIQRHVLREDV